MLSRGQRITKKRRKPSGFLALLALAALSSGCASNQYMGISLRPGGTDPLVQTLAVKAQGGDKQAQYELGRWFEDSTDPKGLKKAIKLYRTAATPRGGTRLLYVPSISGVTTSLVNTGQKIDGHNLSSIRLDTLKIDRPSATRQKSKVWFRKSSEQCKSISFKARSCLVAVNGPSEVDIPGRDISLMKRPYIDISGRQICLGKLCALGGDEIQTGQSLSHYDLVSPVRGASELVGVVVVDGRLAAQAKGILLLTPIGDSLTLKDLTILVERAGFNIGD